MITAIVNFKLPADIDAKKAAELFKGSAPKYRGMKGLVRKYYLFDDKSRIGGGVYLWKTRADAEAVYTPQWQDYIADRYGAAPDIRYFETAVVVDNESDKIGRSSVALRRPAGAKRSGGTFSPQFAVCSLRGDPSTRAFGAPLRMTGWALRGRSSSP